MNLWRASLLLPFLALPVNAAPGEHDPAAELASFQMAPGFAANLFASEEDGVVNPIQIRFDARGRLWTIISTVYPQLEPGQVPNDKVKANPFAVPGGSFSPHRDIAPTLSTTLTAVG